MFLKGLSKKVFVGVFVLAVVSAQAEEKNAEQASGYALGVAIAKEYQVKKLPISFQSFIDGFEDQMSGDFIKMSGEQMRQALEPVKNILAEEQLNVVQKAVEKRSTDENALYLARNRTDPNVRELPSGVQYEIVKEGVGQSPNLNSVVLVNYQGQLVNGQLFDSSEQSGPVQFQVSQVIPGWQQALLRMKPGGEWRVVIPSSLAYGERGVPGTIPPNSVLIFKIRLLKVLDKS